MTVKVADTLGWGWRYIIPEDAQAAWGARLIVTQDGAVDVVWDRTDASGEDGPRARLLALLNERYTMAQLRRDVSAGLKERRILTREAGDISFYEDDDIAVSGNSNGSAGYFYLSAWLKAGR